jgi:Zn-dependent protease
MNVTSCDMVLFLNWGFARLLATAYPGCATIARAMFGTGRSLPLMRIFGIRIGVNASWFLVLFLFIYWLAPQFGDQLDDDSLGFVGAVAATLLFFFTLLLHELGHALAARREGIGVTGIDLFLFGGVMKMSRDTSSPGAEFRVAAAGPAVTLLVVLVGIGLSVALEGWDEFVRAASLDAVTAPPTVVTLTVSFLVTMNFILLVFNLLPAFPLDGGRIARAAAWKITGDRVRATRISARLGEGLSWLMIAYGVWRLLSSDVSGGLWAIVLGWLLGSAARGAVAQSAVTERLEGVTVADVMDAEPVTIPAGIPALQAYDDYFLRYHGWDWFAVVEGDGQFVGLAHRAAVEHAALDEGGGMPIRDVASAGSSENQVPADAPLEALLTSEPLRRLGALMAVDADGRLRGVVTREQVLRALQARLAPSGPVV